MTIALLLLFIGSAKSDTSDQRIADRLEQIISTPPIPQNQLDSLSEQLVYLNNLNGTTSDETCNEIALLKVEIAHAIMRGGRSIHMTNLFGDQSSCKPHHGLYDFILGGIAYNSGNFGLAVEKYRNALEALGIEDQASVLIQLNLSAALEGASRQAEAIDSLNALLNGEHWKAAPGLADGRYNTSIVINAAAILISEKRFTEALDFLRKLDGSNVSEYWKTIKLSNEYIAMTMLAQFNECDSLWASNIKFWPISKVPIDLFEYTLGSWLATDEIDYVAQLMLEEGVSAQLREKEGSVISALLDTDLTDSERKQLWKVLQAANLLERERMQDLATSHEKGTFQQVVFEGLEKKLARVEQTSIRWQWIAVLLGMILIIAGSLRAYFKRKATQEIQAGIQQAKSQRPTVAASKLDITKADIRKIHMGLTKGYQIGEALLSLQKVEIIHNSPSSPLSPTSLQTIKGIDDLSESEFTILQLSLEGISNKEIAHQLQVSSGYVYNSRSAIRKKLDIPKESSIRNWIEHQTT